ncbi:hypothetical protein LTR50_005140 [Elasticomyces elasticus]|nr:hypothetical protein LTR50_005140 [Elasticomyces elasticus]
MTALDRPIPSIINPGSPPLPSPTSSQDSSGSSPRNSRILSRPKLGSRKSSGTMIVSRDCCAHNTGTDAAAAGGPGEEVYDEDDVRAMSPRRSSADIERLGEGARSRMIEQAKTLQASLMAIVDRVEVVRSEHEKLEGGNKFLQSSMASRLAQHRSESGIDDEADTSAS